MLHLTLPDLLIRLGIAKEGRIRFIQKMNNNCQPYFFSVPKSPCILGDIGTRSQ